jgi:DNA-binding winged helix-turn-helix (wHTH) protein/dipeptidyl aminopeptidase/acylaminoacyl peptidase
MYELLLVFLRNADRVLEKEFLLKSVWPDSFVEEGSISFNIRQLRKALGDDAQTPSYIETVPRRGYRFVAKVDESVEDDEEPSAIAATAETTTQGRRSNSLIIGLAFAAVVLVAGLAGIWYLSDRTAKAAPILSSPFGLERLSTDGQVHLSVISPDGKTVVYSRRLAGKQSLWVTQVGTSETSQIVPASGNIYYGLALSPDGNSIYYARGETITGQQADIYRESVYGGVPQKLISEAQGWISLSPDGKKISFVRCPYNKDENCSLWIADSADGANERKLVSRPQPIRIADNKFSPDGKSIAFGVGESRTYSNDFEVSLVDVETGQERELTKDKFFNVGYLAWLPGGQGFLMTARRLPDKSFKIWHVTPAGDALPLTDDSQTYSALSLNGDASVLVTTRVSPSFHLNIYTLGDSVSGPTQLADAQTVNFAPNGDIFFS